MLLSRFWYVVLALVAGALTFALFLATGMYNRASVRAMGEALAADSQVVASYLRDDARKRSSALIPIALNEDIRTQLGKSSNAADKIPNEAKDKVKTALRKEFNAVPAELRFDALFAIDQYGRVVAEVGFDQASGIADFELGGYPVVADALHGWVRDDAWVLGGRIYRVVARPVELEAGAMPAGAIVAARIVDDSYARDLSRRTGAAVGFYTNGSRVASGAPEGFDTAQLDTITNDLKGLDGDQSYKDKGTSDVRTIHDNLGVVYAKLPGEAWDLGAGYAVGRVANLLDSPMAFFQKADDKDKHGVPLPIVGAVTLAAAAIGILFTLLEHSRPLGVFKREAVKFAKGDVDQLTPSKFRGVYRKIASDVNDGVDKLAAKGGAPRRAADLEQVLGPIPAQPSMSAFSLPGDVPPAPPDPSPGPPPPPNRPSGSGPAAPPRPPPPNRPAPPAPSITHSAASPAPQPPVAPKPAPKPPVPAKPATAPIAPLDGEDEATVVSQAPAQLLEALEADATTDELAEWKSVFESFVKTKKECGEPTEGLTFEKFQGTLRKNRDTLIEKHACKKVKFSVYVKEGRAALKASPVKD